MSKRSPGRYETTSVGGEQVKAFVPDPLPPRGLVLDQGGLSERLSRAELALGRLEVAGQMVPSMDWFLYAFVRKEAVLSSQIEGTQATLMDLLSYEAEREPAPNADLEEVSNYLAALSHARAELANPAGLPLSMRLLNQAHRLLMQGARGATKQPGEVRKSQNWIGGTRPSLATHVPPPPQLVLGLLAELERFIHASDGLPSVVRAGLIHVQFETIHPYLDGNGRIGRLLIALVFEHWGVLTRPLLYLSLFFKRHQQEYYRRLSAVRDGDWEGWLDFFADGVATVADEAVQTVRDLFALVSEDRQRLLQHPSASLTALQLFERLPSQPLVTVAQVVEAFQTTKPTAGRAIDTLVSAGILVETTGKRRDRVFAYGAYLDRLRAGTDLEDQPGGR